MIVAIRKRTESSLVVNLRVLPRKGDTLVCRLPNTSTSMPYIVEELIHYIDISPDGTTHKVNIIVDDLK